MTTIQQLSLSDEVKSAVKKKMASFLFILWKIFIRLVNCYLRRDLLDENKDYTEKTEPLSRLIQRRIEGRADSERKKFFGVFPLLIEKRAFFHFSFFYNF